jgi:hypothetical protein
VGFLLLFCILQRSTRWIYRYRLVRDGGGRYQQQAPRQPACVPVASVAAHIRGHAYGIPACLTPTLLLLLQLANYCAVKPRPLPNNGWRSYW